MKVKKIAAVYSIIVGISMIGMWTVFIVSPGYYIQSGDFVFVAMFAVFIILALVFIVMSYLKREKFEV